jgi:hypothetical protein
VNERPLQAGDNAPKLYSAKVQQRSHIAPSNYDRQHTHLAGETAKRAARPLVRDEEAAGSNPATPTQVRGHLQASQVAFPMRCGSEVSDHDESGVSRQSRHKGIADRIAVSGKPLHLSQHPRFGATCPDSLGDHLESAPAQVEGYHAGLVG